MEIIEAGADRGETMLFLHGGGLSWWNYREAAALLESDYRVLLPVLDGHAGSGRPFTTIEDNAEELLAYIDEHCGGSVLLIGGLSLGGQILLEICSIKNIDGLKIIQNKKLNLCMFLKNSSKNKYIKQLNKDLLFKNIKTKNIITKDINCTEGNYERIHHIKTPVYREYKSVDNEEKKNDHVKLKKYNNGKKIWNYVNFNDTVKKYNEKSERRRKSDFCVIRRMIDKSGENTCINNLNVISNEDNKSEISNNNILSRRQTQYPSMSTLFPS